ncbi:hypothetical protein JCM3770_003145 [Rhodotorula araucariae]
MALRELPGTEHVLQRLHHPHYYLNSLLCLPLPLVLLSSTRASSALTTTLLATPLLLAISAALRKRSDNIETLHAGTTSQLRLFNLCGLFFCRRQLGISGWWVLAYMLAWLLVSFFLPQPGYLGPANVRSLTAEEFESQVLLLPPASTFATDATGSSPRIVELAPPTLGSPAAPSPSTSHLIHFHVPHSALSRDLHISLARLSARLASASLAFGTLDASADDAQAAFYDLGLATGPTSRDVPLLRLYRAGEVRAEAPAGEGEARRAVRRRRQVARARTRAAAPGGPQADDDGDKGKGEEEDDSDESEDEREVEQERALSRYRWNTSAAAIERTFQLRELSSGFVRPPAQS